MHASTSACSNACLGDMHAQRRRTGAPTSRLRAGEDAHARSGRPSLSGSAAHLPQLHAACMACGQVKLARAREPSSHLLSSPPCMPGFTCRRQTQTHPGHAAGIYTLARHTCVGLERCWLHCAGLAWPPCLGACLFLRKARHSLRFI